MTRLIGAVAIHAALAVLGASAHAEEGNKMFSVGGFGTAAVTHSSLKNGDFVTDLYQPSGAGKSHDYDLGIDSKLGIQVDGRFTDQFSAVVQVVANTRTNNTFSPRVEWANLKYAITPDLSVRLGRTALPSYMVSDSRLVGYANPWIRPPVETYSLHSVTNLDGIDTSFRQRFGSVGNTVQAFYGKTEMDIVGQTGAVTKDVKAPKIYGIADTIEYGALTVRLGLSNTDLEFSPFPGLTLRATAKLRNLGAIYDPGSWFVQGELTTISLGNLARAQKAWYVTGGYRWQKFTPYVTYSQVKIDDNQSAALTGRDQETTSLGVRWDAMKNTAVKLQWDRVSLGKGSAGFFTNARPGLAGSSGNVVSAAVDFIF